MIVVSNASPLISLARTGQLDLLRRLYGEVLIPEAVWREVVVEGAGQAGAAEIGSASWIQKRAPADRALICVLEQQLDAGEAEAVVLALETKAELLLMDERLGRLAAGRLGIRTTRLIGILVESKHKGLIQAVKPFLEALRDVAGFRIGEDLLRRVLRDEGE